MPLSTTGLHTIAGLRIVAVPPSTAGLRTVVPHAGLRCVLLYRMLGCAAVYTSALAEKGTHHGLLHSADSVVVHHFILQHYYKA